MERRIQKSCTCVWAGGTLFGLSFLADTRSSGRALCAPPYDLQLFQTASFSWKLSLAACLNLPELLRAAKRQSLIIPLLLWLCNLIKLFITFQLTLPPRVSVTLLFAENKCIIGWPTARKLNINICSWCDVNKQTDLLAPLLTAHGAHLKDAIWDNNNNNSR